VADAIDAAVLPKQRADGEPVLDLALRDPRAAQLLSRNNPMRSARQPGYFSIRVK
jgi:hypothetical protein